MGSSPNLPYGYVASNGQWNSFFAAKQDDLGYVPLNTAGGTLTGKLTTAPSTVLASGFNLPEGTAPTFPLDGDVWTTTAGLFVQINGITIGPIVPGATDWKEAANLATVVALPTCVYDNGLAGIGATLTATGNGALSVDGVVVVGGNRILVKNQVTVADNGVYTVTQVGDSGSPFILTRAPDYNQEDLALAGSSLFVDAGNTLAGTFWVQSSVVSVIGTDAISFVEFSPVYVAGTGLTLTGYTFSVTDGTTGLPLVGNGGSGPTYQGLSIAGGGTQTPAGSLAIKTTAGPFTVTTEDWIVLNKGSPSATSIVLPSVASRGGRALRVSDWAGNAGDITFTPNGAETIMGLSSAVVGSNGQGLGSAANVMLCPSADLSGWLIS